MTDHTFAANKRKSAPNRTTSLLYDAFHVHGEVSQTGAQRDIVWDSRMAPGSLSCHHKGLER